MSLWVITVRDRECGEFLNAIGPFEAVQARTFYDELTRAQRVICDIANSLPELDIDMLRMEEPSSFPTIKADS